MPLILSPAAHSRAALAEISLQLTTDLLETREMVAHPRGAVRDPASLGTATELIDAAVERIRRGSGGSRDELAANANLAYATLLAAIDLVKSHTDVPRVPARRPAK